MRSATLIYRYLTAVFTADVLLQFFLAGAGVFSADGGTAARESGALDPHRANGMAVTLLALLMLIAALVAGNGRWRWALPLFLLTLLQPVLAIAGRREACTRSTPRPFWVPAACWPIEPGAAMAVSDPRRHR